MRYYYLFYFPAAPNPNDMAQSFQGNLPARSSWVGGGGTRGVIRSKTILVLLIISVSKTNININTHTDSNSNTFTNTISY